MRMIIIYLTFTWACLGSNDETLFHPIPLLPPPQASGEPALNLSHLFDTCLRPAASLPDASSLFSLIILSLG